MCNLLKTKVAKRMAIAKTVGFAFGLLGFLLLPTMVSIEVSLQFKLAILFWYTTLWGLVGLFGYMDKHPVFTNWKFPWYFRGLFIWAWMNLVLVLFIHSDLVTLMNASAFAGYSPYWIITEWMFIWFIADYFATKFGGEGKELCK